MPPNNSLDSLSMEQPTSVHRWARIDRVCLMGERGRGREGERGGEKEEGNGKRDYNSNDKHHYNL